jgi:hypothetical protein
MKPQRITMTHHVVLAYGLHNHMDVYVSAVIATPDLFWLGSVPRFVARVWCHPLAVCWQGRPCAAVLAAKHALAQTQRLLNAETQAAGPGRTTDVSHQGASAVIPCF